MSPPTTTLRVMDLAVEQVRAATKYPVEVAASTRTRNRLPVVLVDASTPVPVGNAPDTWSAQFTLTVTVLSKNRAEALDIAHAITDHLITARQPSGSGWFSHVRAVSLPILSGSNGLAGDGVWAATAALAITARH